MYKSHKSLGPVYSVWRSMIQRCHNPKHISFKHYGARGISVCQEWRENYFAFEEFALSKGWKKGLHTDRIDNELGYCPENVQFLSVRDNERKKSSTRMTVEKIHKIFDLYSEGKTLAEIKGIMNYDAGNISLILNRKLWADVHNRTKSTSTNGMAQKMTAEKVREALKAHYLEGASVKGLARKYGLAPNNMRYILRGKMWNTLYREFQYLLMFLKPSPTADYMRAAT